jgi:hypothetical protein
MQRRHCPDPLILIAFPPGGTGFRYSALGKADCDRCGVPQEAYFWAELHLESQVGLLHP